MKTVIVTFCTDRDVHNAVLVKVADQAACVTEAAAAGLGDANLIAHRAVAVEGNDPEVTTTRANKQISEAIIVVIAQPLKVLTKRTYVSRQPAEESANFLMAANSPILVHEQYVHCASVAGPVVVSTRANRNV